MLGMCSCMLWTPGVKITLHINLKAPYYLEQTLGFPVMAERQRAGRNGLMVGTGTHREQHLMSRDFRSMIPVNPHNHGADIIQIFQMRNVIR